MKIDLTIPLHKDRFHCELHFHKSNYPLKGNNWFRGTWRMFLKKIQKIWYYITVKADINEVKCMNVLKHQCIRHLLGI